MNKKLAVRRRTTLAGLGLLAVAVGAVPTMAMARDVDETPPIAVEDYSYPGAAKIEAERGIKLISGDGRIMLSDCDGNPDLIKVEALTEDVCFAVKGDTGWLSLRLDAVFLVAAGDQDVAVTVEGMSAPISVPEGKFRPIQAVDPARRGVVLEIRATPGN